MLSACQIFVNDGDGILKTARGGLRRPTVFTPGILYNLLTAAIEKYIMAVMVYRKKMAGRHTFADLVNSVQDVEPMPADLVERLRTMGKYQEICPVFVGYKRRPVPGREIPGMLEAAEAVQRWMRAALPAPIWGPAGLPQNSPANDAVNENLNAGPEYIFNHPFSLRNAEKAVGDGW
jgi:hypothetical protein